MRKGRAKKVEYLSRLVWKYVYNNKAFGEDFFKLSYIAFRNQPTVIETKKY